MIDDPSTGEAHRRIDRLEMRLDQRVVSLNAYQAEREALRGELKDLREDLQSMSDRLTWAWRIAITGIIFPIMATIIGALALTTILGGQ